MDSVSLNVTLIQTLGLKEDNGSLPDTTFYDRQESAALYGAIGTATGTIDRLYYDELVLDKSATVGINLTSLPVSPEGVGSGGALVKITDFHLKMIENADESTAGSGIRMGDSAGTNMAKLWFGSVSTTVDIGKDGFESHHDDAGFAVGGNSIKFTNLDSSNTVTFTLLLCGRSA